MKDKNFSFLDGIYFSFSYTIKFTLKNLSKRKFNFKCCLPKFKLSEKKQSYTIVYNIFYLIF